MCLIDRPFESNLLWYGLRRAHKSHWLQFISLLVCFAISHGFYRMDPRISPYVTRPNYIRYTLRPCSGGSLWKGGSKFLLYSTSPNSKDSGVPKLDFNECYYSVIEVDPKSDSKEVKKAYYKMVLQYHPDNKPNLSEEEKVLRNRQMMVINAAYKILKSSTTRRHYDKKRTEGKVGAKAGVKASGVVETRQKRQDKDDRDRADRERSDKERSDRESSTTSSDNGKTSPNSRRPRQGSTAANFNDKMQDQVGADGAQGGTGGGGGTDFESHSSGSYSDAEQYFNRGAGRYDHLDEETRRYAQSRRGAHPRDNYKAYEEPFSVTRGDGSAKSLKAYLKALIIRKTTLATSITSDNRDWGEESNMDLVKARLRDIEEVKRLAVEIRELEDEIENLQVEYHNHNPNPSPLP